VALVAALAQRGDDLGTAARILGTAARILGTPARILGTPARILGTPARILGTPARIPDAADALVQVRGFNGFSYADISAELGITNAALHYHFAGNADLGEALAASR
jgi:AcrR family transcriptional regulator